MCGLTGFLQSERHSGSEARLTLARMVHTIRHRGPDDNGVWVDEGTGVGLAHARLSILDLTPAGHQPMMSRSCRFVIVFNGEIYNHLAIRRELESNVLRSSVRWCGHSDTETLLAGIDAWGLEQVLRRTIGMFALALWDRQEQTLTLARDRMGEKPLYYGWQRGVFLFGSELKALKAHPAFEGEIDRGAIALQMRHNYIPSPYSIYRGIYKLPPGHCLKVAGSLGSEQNYPMPYWSFLKTMECGQSNLFYGSDAEAVDALDGLLRVAVAQEMVADVPLGAFLSGGVDSTAIVALMQSQSARRVKTFTIGFNEASHDEAAHAKIVAAYLGTEHTELYVTPQQCLTVIPKLPCLYDEPFSDSSQIPTYLVSQLARQQVTVCLSGDGGDELFGGYGRYAKATRLRSRIPQLSGFLQRVSCEAVARIGQIDSNRSESWQQLHDLLGAQTNAEFYLPRVSHWKRPSSLVIDGHEPLSVFTDSERVPHTSELMHDMMALDTLAYLPDDVLVKVDRAAMGVSLETRVPMLDHRVVEFAARLPLTMKVRNGRGKWILRQVLYKYVPKSLIERPKRGFSVPIDLWLRGPLRDWAESLLDESRLRQEGYFWPQAIRKKWADHLSGKRNWKYHLWDVLMFQAWLEEQER